MAYKLTTRKSLSRKDLIKAISSRGWQLDYLMKARKHDTITITSYFIRAQIDTVEYMLIFQPTIRELTVIGPTEQHEKAIKKMMLQVFEDGLMGNLPKMEPQIYKDAIEWNSWNRKVLSESEVGTILDEFDDQKASEINYIN